MELVSSCFKCLGEILLDPLKRQVKYIKDFKKHVHHLQSKWKELLAQEKDVIQQVEREKERLMNILNQNVVDHWLENVEGLKEPVKGIENEFRDDKRCLNGCLPNYYSRRKLGKETKSLIKEVKNLIENKPSINVDANQVPPARLGIPAEPFKGASAKKAFESIRNCLMNEEIAKIGVYGMGGVGKTTIIKNIKNSLQKENIFTEIIFVTVSRCLDLKTIQKAIADQIGLKLDSDYNEESLSTMLYEALQRKRRFLLILDDLWSELPLKDIGIPEPHVNCKVVLTTRSYSVCQCMGTQEQIKVEVLSQDDAWSLFQENAHMDDPQVKDVAEQVVEECGGLPLAIKIVGQALRGENDVRVWRNALNQLRGSATDIASIEELVFDKLKFSFDRLKNEKLQACFLYCSLFPEDYNIKENVLIDHWIWDGLIDQMDDKQAEVDNGHSLLNELKRVCMLEFADGSDTVKMHDLMRDMAICITKHNPRFMVKAGLRLEKTLAKNEWPEDVERISLMNSHIKILSGQPRCPRLRTLLLNDNYAMEIIPHSFFDNMCNLRVLDLSHTGIEMLPDSICKLEKLHVLLLNNCLRLKKMPSPFDLKNLEELNLRRCYRLRMVPSLANLKKLKRLCLIGTHIEELPESLSDLENLYELDLKDCEKLKRVPSLVKVEQLRILNLASTDIEELPIGMERLVALEILDLSGTKRLRRFPHGILPKLSLLKKFSTKDSLCLWSSNNAGTMEGRIDCNEIAGLSRLTEASFDCDDHLTAFFHLLKFLQEKVLELRALIKSSQPRSSEFEGNAFLKFKTMWGYEIKLTKYHDFNCFSDVLLHFVLKESCDNMQFVHVGPDNILLLPNLRKIKVFACPKLKNLLSLQLLQSLQRLQSIIVMDCDTMEELIAGDDDETGEPIVFPMLMFLELINLPALERISSKPLVCNSLKEIMIQKCPRLKKFPLCMNNLQSIIRFSIEECDTMEELISEDDKETREQIVFPMLWRLKLINLPAFERINSKQVVCNSLKEIKIQKCPHLKKFPLCMNNLQRVKTISVEECNTMEELIVGDDDKTGEPIILSNMSSLELINLPALERIRCKLLVCNSLKKIMIQNCPRLKKFPLCLNSLQRVETISVEECNTMEELIVGDDDETGEPIVFPMLRYLDLINLPALERISSKPLVCNSLGQIEIKKCPRLKKFPLCMNSLQSIEAISVEDCNMMEELIAGDDEETGQRIVFPMLGELELINLPALERISSKPLVCNTLEDIEIKQCPRLKKFPLCMSSLQRIETILVEECNMMEELIAGDDAGEQIIFPILRNLELINLPAFERISNKPIVCDSLSGIEIIQCPRLKKILLCIGNRQPNVFRRYFKGKKEWWDALDWHDPTNTKPLFRTIFTDEYEEKDDEGEKPDGEH